jgi:SAM-dependent methyltransferase
MPQKRLSTVELDRIRAGTRDVYERHATAWDRHRPKMLLEKAWLERFLEHVPVGGTILDLGCGAGEPIIGYLLERDRKVVGVDFAAAMLDIARRRYPGARFLQQDIRHLDLDGTFEGALSWDGSFHLTREEQSGLIAALGRLLAPGAPVMLTVGPEDGEITGVVEGHLVYHSSLSPEAYRQGLAENGFVDIEFVAEDPDCDQHSVVFGTKKRSQSRSKAKRGHS